MKLIEALTALRDASEEEVPMNCTNIARHFGMTKDPDSCKWSAVELLS
ncbi:hypothetical protein M0R72_14790 [Candidatus Pacearchaeota archaeon]|jgi:hypothetical protein|nr:hypothetical protein [Candidatus Pacearchaeota archaeon]